MNGSPPFSSGLRGGAAIALDRLRSRAFLVSFSLGLALSIVAALVEKSVSPYGSVDRGLAVAFTWVIPLLSFATVSRAVGRLSLRDAAWPVARFGSSRASVGLGLVATSALACAAISLVVALVVVAFAHTSSSPPIAHDLMTSAWIAALTGGAYAAWLSFGASMGRRGGGRVVFLLFDFALGRTNFFGAVFPRGNAANLLGFDAPFDISQRISSAILFGSMVLVIAIATWRSRD